MYATIQDMRALYGSDELTSLSDRAGTGEMDEALLTASLERAASEADSYLARRYPVPLGQNGGAVPPVLTRVVCDIARYLLTGGPASETDPIATRYAQAVSWLNAIAAGKADLPLPVAAQGTAMAFTSGRRQWAQSTEAESE